MVWLEIIVVLGAIFFGIRQGGIGIGLCGGLGLAILTLGFGLPMGSPPVDVILIIMTVVVAASALQAAGGMDYLVRVAGNFMRRNPKYINIIAPIITYNDRLTANTGGGLSIILMYAYIPALILIYISKPSKISLIICLLLSVFCGLIYYVVIGGSRNVLAAGIFSLIYLALYFKHITKKFLALIIVCGVFTLMILELYRYANNITDAINFIMNGGMEVILFAFESFSPMHAVININEALDKRLIEPQYLSTFFNEFSIIIPRFLWEDKPINVLNNGYFYTTEVLSLDTNLTMSPTFLGTSLIMFGSWFYWVGGFISGVILFVFDRSFSHSSNLYWKIILLSSVGYLFFWVRDGFEVFCYILIKFFIVMFIYKNLTIIYKSLARKNEF